MPAPHGDRVAFAVSTPTTGPGGQIRPPGDCHAVGRGNLQQQLTSVFPMTESGPGLGGAKRQKSSTEFTIQELFGLARPYQRCATLTVCILTHRRVTMTRATFVGAGLALLTLVWSIRRQIGRAVRLG